MPETPPPCSAQSVWAFNPDQLLPGDILLELGQTLFSPVVAALDGGGQYSHALIWAGGSDFIESVPPAGSRAIGYPRLLVFQPNRWLLLRMIGDQDTARRAAEQARNLVFMPYSYRGAAASKIGMFGPADHATIFCSQLVAEAYSRCGVSLISGIPSSKITPNMLRYSPLLTELIAPLVKVSVDNDELEGIIKLYKDRDKAYKLSQMANEQRISQGLCILASVN